MLELVLRDVFVEIEGMPVVRNASFSITGGTIAALMGPNGSGKSSLSKAIMGHPSYRITHGRMRLGSRDITDMKVEERAKLGLFLSFQHVPDIGGTTLASFLYNAHQCIAGSGRSALAYYKELCDLADTFSIRRSLLDRPLSAGLSGGEKKLSELLQLAALKPNIAILDEIDSGMDIDSMRKLFSAIQALKEDGMGFILISHHSSLLDHISPDAVHIMGNGTLVCSGGPELAREVLTNGFCSVIHCSHAGTCEGTCGKQFG